jgi:ubiquinone/menaquinone biosynthesis C-methylase UbiE
MSHAAVAQSQAILAFDQLAEGYDNLFTKSLIGRAQRDAVWSIASQTFRSGDHILELNCGTGEDALFLARNGVSVFACDASERMILIASQRLHRKATADARVQFNVLPTERLREIRPTTMFDGAFSNFSGLNCVTDLKQTVNDLSNLLSPGAPLLICLSTRFCISEIVWFLFHGKFRKAFRRCSGRATAKVGEFTVDVYYPTVRQLQKLFSPSFILQSVTGIGVTIPPSYVESWIRKYPILLSLLWAIDKTISSLPGFRVVGDHVLLRFERGHG